MSTVFTGGEMINSPETDMQVWCNSYKKSQQGFFVDIDKITWKFVWNIKGIIISEITENA